MTSDPVRRLVLGYAPEGGRAALAALLLLDDTLVKLVRTTREPALAQLRLAWWRESLPKLDKAPPPAEPVLQGIFADVLAQGVTGASLVPIVYGWEVLIEEARLDEEAMLRFAEGRGGLFVAAGAAMGAGPNDPLHIAGRGWALVDLAGNLSTADEAAAARALARPLLDAALARRWSRNTRALGAMAHLARMEMDERLGPVSRLARLMWHRLSGR